MKLNRDCIRDVLLFLEENLTYNNCVDFPAIEISNYEREDLLYTVDKLQEAQYLVGSKYKFKDDTLPNIRISAITWSGHQFLDNIRDDNVWNDTKRILSKFSSISLNMVSMVASEIITAMVKRELNLY